MENLYKRESYLEKIRPFYDVTELIKVITGVRRCGKSSLMRLVAQELSERGIPEQNIIFLNLDQRKYRGITTADSLDSLIEGACVAKGTKYLKETKYLFIDEVQNVEGFETVVNGWREEGDVSIFITGSNSYLLSGELATKLTGRYLQFEMFTLSFSEYRGMKEFLGKPVSTDIMEEFDSYILEGGFPMAVRLDGLTQKRAYVQEIVREIFEKDVSSRSRIQNRMVFERVRDYVINNFAATTSVRNLIDYLRNVEGISVKRETVYRYLKLLEEAKILYRCPRFDMKSKRSLKREEKFYLADLSFYFALNTNNRINYGPVLENIVYLHARRMGCAVSVGRIGKLECDFIVRDKDSMEYAYVQVAYTIAERSTEEREYASLERIADGYPKYLLTCDRLTQRRSGIYHENLPRFVSEDRRFLHQV